VAAARWLAERGARRLSLLLPEATWVEFGDFDLDHQRPDHVVVGDLGDGWTFAVLDRALRALLGGAKLLAVHKNRWWNPGDGPRIDAGAFVAALEYASGQTALVVGKPSAAFFRTAAAELGVPLERVAVVGDSLANDVLGAQEIGCLGVAVRTGTFSAEALAAAPRPPDAVLDSFADLPDWLGVE
jgi:HAD superfamily hydrolase (TIGR01458 family)